MKIGNLHINLFLHHIWGDRRSSNYSRYEFKTKRLGIFFSKEREGNTYINGVAVLKELPTKYTIGVDLIVCRLTINITVKIKIKDGGN